MIAIIPLVNALVKFIKYVLKPLPISSQTEALKKMVTKGLKDVAKLLEGSSLLPLYK